MASGPITSWEIDGETVETVSDFILLGSKITADGDCSHEITLGNTFNKMLNRSVLHWHPCLVCDLQGKKHLAFYP